MPPGTARRRPGRRQLRQHLGPLGRRNDRRRPLLATGIGNRAHASKWTQATGVVDLGGTITGQASRANGVNYDGSVIVGWVETPTGPVASRRVGQRHAASSSPTTTTADDRGLRARRKRVNSANGDIIVGFSSDPVVRPARRRHVEEDRRRLGSDADPGLDRRQRARCTATRSANAISADGSIAVGYASYAGDPFDVDGLHLDAGNGRDRHSNQFLANNGVFVDPNFTSRACTR